MWKENDVKLNSATCKILPGNFLLAKKNAQMETTEVEIQNWKSLLDKFVIFYSMLLVLLLPF